MVVHASTIAKNPISLLSATIFSPDQSSIALTTWIKEAGVCGIVDDKEGEDIPKDVTSRTGSNGDNNNLYANVSGTLFWTGGQEVNISVDISMGSLTVIIRTNQRSNLKFCAQETVMASRTPNSIKSNTKLSQVSLSIITFDLCCLHWRTTHRTRPSEWDSTGSPDYIGAN